MTSSEFGVKFDLLSTNSLHISKLQYDKSSGTQDLLTWLIILLVEYLADPHQLAPTNLAPSILDLGKVCSTVSLSARFSPFTLCFSWTLCLHLLYQWCPGCMCGLAASYQGHSWTVRLFSLPSAPKKSQYEYVWMIFGLSRCVCLYLCVWHICLTSGVCSLKPSKLKLSEIANILGPTSQGLGRRLPRSSVILSFGLRFGDLWSLRRSETLPRPGLFFHVFHYNHYGTFQYSFWMFLTHHTDVLLGEVSSEGVIDTFLQKTVYVFIYALYGLFCGFYLPESFEMSSHFVRTSRHLFHMWKDEAQSSPNSQSSGLKLMKLAPQGQPNLIILPYMFVLSPVMCVCVFSVYIYICIYIYNIYIYTYYVAYLYIYLHNIIHMLSIYIYIKPY